MKIFIWLALVIANLLSFISVSSAQYARPIHMPPNAWKPAEPDQYINVVIGAIIVIAVTLFAFIYKASKGSSEQDKNDGGDSVQNFLKHREGKSED